MSHFWTFSITCHSFPFLLVFRVRGLDFPFLFHFSETYRLLSASSFEASSRGRFLDRALFGGLLGVVYTAVRIF